jgi:redox-sensitive bicupin YhaK (pirin superfamily)
MMLTLRPSLARGYADHGWLKSFHSFSFADYFDPQHMGWGNLRVINEDWIAPARALARTATATWRSSPTSCPGNLAHKDSMGNIKGIPPAMCSA